MTFDTDCESDWNLMSFESDEYNVPIISCKTGNISEHHQPEHRGSCLEKYDQEVLTMNDFSPYATPPLSPMSSYASCSSSFGDIWTGLNLQGREDGCGVIDTGEKQRGGGSVDNDSPTMLPNFETDPGIWEPPEPECMEDDQPSIADNYEDDEYSSTDWKQPSSLSILDEHQGINHSFREKRQKAMLEEMNRQFKVLVSRFLASEGISFSGLDDGQSWLGIVASLSWKAALLVKPDATKEGQWILDPIELIKGLVFKKHAAHKHMPTKFKNPKLLLLQGALGHSAVGLSSFDSMGQEKDYLRSLAEMIEACHPNVVLVEKNISRDIQESLTEKGITLVSDMKLHRLERISLCTGSPIISCANFPAKFILPQCDSFHIERFVEECNNISEDTAERSSSDELKKIKQKNALDVPKYNESLGIINDTAFSASQDISLNSELLHQHWHACVIVTSSTSAIVITSLCLPRKIPRSQFSIPKSNHESSSFFMNNRTFDGQVLAPHALLDVSDHENPVSSDVSGEMIDETGPVGDLTEAVDADACSTVESKPQDDMESVLNSQSIIVLLSKQCTIKGVICRQSHLSRIKYYGHFDISIGRFLRDILLNQNSCSSCSEPPEAHMYLHPPEWESKCAC
ncbi:Phosphatidylinositol-4-phosphate 5-Kinase [Musa troglodytarum]|uniref:Phosphatidylinositol-4-phosphate 5-Kinase n=1 Tax=Musa troglodytarum TaxID=320322 RepID=A0A9E7H8I4_9LILI|nr:Phosphatidylinositol-4-phosphate 5-Kinase [Musa troglodytarum]